MLILARNLTGTLIGGIVFGTVLFGHAYAAETKCTPYESSVAHLLENTTDNHLKFGAIGAPDMPEFTAMLQKQGAAIKGERAYIMLMPNGAQAIYTKVGNKLCIAAILAPASSTAAPAPAAPKPKVEGQEWL